MQWSYPILRVGGTEIRIHLTFLLLLVWIGIAYFQEGGTSAAIEGVGFIGAVFACVVLHELGHVAAASRYGIRTPKITLLPIGGVAELERLPEKPSEEIVVALAGPLVNVVIASFLVVALGTTVGVDALTSMDNPRVAFVARLAAVNIWLVLFNLIPAFPMDGGRVLRALLATRACARRRLQGPSASSPPSPSASSVSSPATCCSYSLQSSSTSPPLRKRRRWGLRQRRVPSTSATS